MKEPFEIVEKDGRHAIKLDSAVAVILYTTDENDVLDKIGIITEKNPHFQDKTYTSVVLGKIERDDQSLLQRAKQEVKEEAGFSEIEHSRWDFLGEMYSSKILPETIYCYSADVTGIVNEEPKGDGSEWEEGIRFDFIPLHKISSYPDSILHSCFLRLFMKMNKKMLLNGTTKQKTEKALG